MPIAIRHSLIWALLMAFAGGSGPGLPAAEPQVAPAYGSVVDTYSTEKIADGVYAFIAPTSKGSFVNSNTLVVIGDAGVLVVDSGNVLTITRRIIADIKRLTDQPVRYLVNTHWHWDHVLGNAEYRAAFPAVAVVTTTMTRDLSEKRGRENITSMLAVLPGALEGMRESLRTGKNKNDVPLSPEDREFTESQVAGYEVGLVQYRELQYVPPAITFDHEMTVHLGRREIKLLHLGRGNTAGDAVVYVPDVKVVATGDLVVAPIPYASDSFYLDWPQTMRRLMEVDAAAIVPGHGPVQNDWSYARLVTDLLDSLLAQVEQGVAQGLNVEDTRKRVDVESYRRRITGGDPFMIRMFDQLFVQPAIDRAYAEVKEHAVK